MNDIKTALKLTERNIKIFFRDKGYFLSALISPLVLLLLYVLFLHSILKQSFMLGLGGISLDEGIINGYVAAYEVSSILAVGAVTVAFIANTVMTDDKFSGVREDLLIAPVKRGVVVISYYLATAVVTLIVCYVALLAGFIYIAIMGWELTVGDCFASLLNVLLAVLFGTALSSVVFSFVRSRGAVNAVTTIVSVVYGFLCGAYYPIAQFSSGVANLVMCLPGTYFTGLIRAPIMAHYFDAFVGAGFPEEGAQQLLDSLDGNMYFFDSAVPTWAMYLVTLGSIAVLVAAFVVINVLQKGKRK